MKNSLLFSQETLTWRQAEKSGGCQATVFDMTLTRHSLVARALRGPRGQGSRATVEWATLCHTNCP